MYEIFFGFKEKPFNITPDPKYLYLSGQHQEAIAHLMYGIRERGGFVAITGEIGTGKTTLCRHLINQMDEDTEGAIIFNPNLSVLELLKSINEDFGIRSSGETKKELVDELNRCLLEERLRGKNMVLIIDEAQNLDPAVLEQIRMLSNLETEKEKLLQIILIGQPQLKDLLARPELRQLDQRITARYHLNPLNRNETYQYIQHRLDVAATTTPITFDKGAMAAVYRFSKGIPRLINVVCDRALLGAFAAGLGSPIKKKTVKQAISEVTGASASLRERLSLNRASTRVFVYSFTFILVAAFCWYVFAALDSLQKAQNTVTGAELIPDTAAKPVTEPTPTVQSEQPQTEPIATIARAEPSPVVQPTPPPLILQLPSVPYSEEEKAGLINLLLSEKYGESRVGAVRSLLSIWGKTPNLSVADVNSLYGLAVSQGMRCTELWTNFEGLRDANLPCILEMFVPQDLRPRYAVLGGLGKDTAEILYADAPPVKVPLQLLDEFWLRRAFVFWIDFEQLGELLRPGDSGSQVVWLQAGLQTLNFYKGDLTGVFDPVTEEAVRTFQQANNLLTDGVVGPKTKLVLYGNLHLYPMPRLDSKNI